MRKEIVLFCAACRRGRRGGGIQREIAGKYEAEQREEKKKSGHIKEPIVTQGTAGFPAVSVSLVWMMMVFAHDK